MSETIQVKGGQHEDLLAGVNRTALEDTSPLPAPPFLAAGEAEAGDAAVVVSLLREQLAASGLAAVRLDRMLTAEEFLTLARLWGTPIPEHSPGVQPFVEHECILHLVMRWGGTDNVDRQPFSASPILLHTEGSRRPIVDQPRFLLFDCIEPPADGSGGGTIVVPMADVVTQLDTATRAVLSGIVYVGEGMPPVLRWEGGRPVFSFRDFGTEWPDLSLPPGIDSADAVPALIALLHALYRRDALYSVRWQPNMVVVLDNWRLFHGRTAVAERADRWDARHLRRIRVLAPDEIP